MTVFARVRADSRTIPGLLADALSSVIDYHVALVVVFSSSLRRSLLLAVSFSQIDRLFYICIYLFFFLFLGSYQVV